MGYRFYFKILGLALVLNFALSLDAHSGTGSIVARDTDDVSYLKGKLTRLMNLLKVIEDSDEGDLLKVALQNKKGATTDKPELSAEDMRHVENDKVDQGPSKEPALEISKKTGDVKTNQNLVPPRDRDSIEILVKALARMKDPSFNKEDSTGDNLGTDYNESRLDDDQNTQDMETMIRNALYRLDQDKNENKSGKSVYKGVDSHFLHESKSQVKKIKEEGLRFVETRLIETVLFANKIGISVNDIIQDLDNKAAQDVKLDEIEKDLDTMNRKK